MYQQATRSNAGTMGLLVLLLLDFLVAIPGAFVVCGRMIWTLARDDATPASGWLRHVSKKHRNPFNAQILSGCLITILGCIYIGNPTAFNAFVGTFAILTTLSYLSAILPHLLTARKYVKPGPFWMPSPYGPIAIAIACCYIVVFDVIYMFPYALPVDETNMNYSCVMVGGITILLTLGYLWKRKHGYEGPDVTLDGRDDILVGTVGLSKEEEEAKRRDR